MNYECLTGGIQNFRRCKDTGSEFEFIRLQLLKSEI